MRNSAEAMEDGTPSKSPGGGGEKGTSGAASTSKSHRSSSVAAPSVSVHNPFDPMNLLGKF